MEMIKVHVTREQREHLLVVVQDRLSRIANCKRPAKVGEVEELVLLKRELEQAGS